MDQDTQTPLPPSVTHKQDLARRRKRAFAISGAALAGIVVLVAAGYFVWKSGILAPGLLPKGSQLVLASDSLPLAGAQVIDLKGKTITPLMVEGQGTAVVIDAGSSEKSDYYLLSDPEFTRVNLYQKDAADPDAGFDQLTFSSDLKYNLSVDPASGFAAYVSASTTDAEPHVFVWDPIRKEVKDLGVGLHPHVLPDGFFVLFERGDSLISIEIASREEHEVLTVAGNAPFALDAARTRIALYNPIANDIQFFSIEGLTSASYLSSTPLGTDSVPDEILVTGDSVVQVRADAADALTLTNGKRSAGVPLGGLSLENTNISIHD